MPDHKCTLQREGKVVREGLNISLDISSGRQGHHPTVTASFITQEHPMDLEVGDQLRMLLDDGRSADVSVARISEIGTGLYLVGFVFSSNLE
jgi:hypothetical protein